MQTNRPTDIQDFSHIKSTPSPNWKIIAPGSDLPSREDWVSALGHKETENDRSVVEDLLIKFLPRTSARCLPLNCRSLPLIFSTSYTTLSSRTIPGRRFGSLRNKACLGNVIPIHAICTFTLSAHRTSFRLTRIFAFRCLDGTPNSKAYLSSRIRSTSGLRCSERWSSKEFETSEIRNCILSAILIALHVPQTIYEV